jgi:FkbM family methyltransferase
VGTAVGRVAERARDRIERYGASLECVGTVANDQLAITLVTRLSTRHFVDVGAHIGSIIAAVRRHCPSTRISAVEPIPAKAARLRHRFAGINLFECALSDRAGSASFFVNRELSGYSSLNPTGGDVEITVPLKRLDSLVTDPDVVKIDVEGAELGVLRGAEGLKARPVYMFESGPAEVLGYTKADMWKWFTDREYAVFLPNRLAHTAAAMTLEVFLDSHLYPRRTTNYFGVPNEQVDEVRERARKIIRSTRRSGGRA